MVGHVVKGKQVLIAEDNEINQVVTVHILKKLEAVPNVAGNGIEAVEKVKAGNYDLVLMDIQMPGMDGYEATRHLRSELKSQIPIIAMTAFIWEGEKEKCLDCGMNGYIAKPFTLEILAAAIEEVFSSKDNESNPCLLTSDNVQIDLSTVYEVSGDDNSYVSVIINAFLDNMPPAITRMDVALAQKDYKELYKAAHYAKSSFSVIKVADVYDILRKIEQNAKHATDLDSLPSLIDDVRNKFTVAEQVLSERFKNAASE